MFLFHKDFFTFKSILTVIKKKIKLMSYLCENSTLTPLVYFYISAFKIKSEKHSVVKIVETHNSFIPIY